VDKDVPFLLRWNFSAGVFRLAKRLSIATCCGQDLDMRQARLDGLCLC
jgi:hypothetical protein